MLIGMNNVMGGGDSWVVNPANGLPDVKTLAVGVNTLTFTVPSLEYGYKPWACVADGQPAPKFTSVTFSGTTMTVVTEAITVAQTGGSGSTAGTDCKVKIRIIK